MDCSLQKAETGMLNLYHVQSYLCTVIAPTSVYSVYPLIYDSHIKLKM